MAFNLADVLKNVSDSGTSREQIQYIPLSELAEDPNNFYQLSDIGALADNIALCGLQQPIRVRPFENGSYRIVSGHRRRAALEMLVADGYDQWKEAPCIVEADDASPTLQQLRLIYANANTRKMTPAEVSEQAEQVEKLLYQLKEEGYDFPGRMRDHVAEAVSVSKSKLARLKVIRENLDPSWADDWKSGALTESQAYALAQMPLSWQSIIKKDWPYAVNSLTADRLVRFRERFEQVAKIQCQYGLQLCEHTVTMMGNICKDNYTCYCSGCCFECDSLQTCKNCCPEAVNRKKELKAIAKKATMDAKQEQTERDRPGVEFAKTIWQRVGQARQHNGVSVEAVVKARGVSCYSSSYDDDKHRRLENGQGPYLPDAAICFGTDITARGLMNVRNVADALNCSVDYLLGRTEVPEVNTGIVPDSDTIAEPAENVSNSGTTWNTDNPEEEGDYLLILKDHYRVELKYEPWHWDGSEWKAEGYGSFYPDIDGDIIGWVPLPTPPKQKTDSALNESCITGMSPSGHCGAAAYCSNEHTCCLQCSEKCNSRCGWIEDAEAFAENEE